MIIGAKRGGSTSFYFDLLEHPNVCPLFPRPNLLPKAEPTKGIHYFDVNYLKGERWFRSYLPSRYTRNRQAAKVGSPVVTGEGSPYYLFHPVAPARAAAVIPDVKMILVLRDPVQRTYSHWKERRRNGLEELDFVDALAAEDDRIGDAEQRLIDDPTYYSYAHEHESYARQSEYDTSLRRWLEHFGPERFLVLPAEDYYRDPAASLERAANFLDLPRAAFGTGEVRNAAPGGSLDRAVGDRLAARFAAHNENLEKLTGERFDWW